jgi:hypothetical protein
MRKLSLWVLAIAAASASVATTGTRSQAGLVAPIGWREAADTLRPTETVQFTWRGQRYSGTTSDGEAPAGTGVALAGGAAWAGVVRPGGTAGDGRATAQSRVRQGEVGPESNVRNPTRAGRDHLFAMAAGRRVALCA